MPECPSSYMGRDLMMALGSNIQLLSLTQKVCHFTVLLISNQDSGHLQLDSIPTHILHHLLSPNSLGQGTTQVPFVQIKLKYMPGYLCKLQYPLRIEAHKGLNLLVDKLLQQELIVFLLFLLPHSYMLLKNQMDSAMDSGLTSH